MAFSKHKKVLAVIFGALLVLGILLLAFISTSGNEDIPAVKEVSRTGIYTCLPYASSEGMQTLECALGLQTSSGDNYALDTASLPIDTLAQIIEGDEMTVDGTLTPSEISMKDDLKKYDIEGSIAVAAIAAVNRSVLFSCDDEKQITAIFHPMSDSQVDLTLSDGRELSVPHATSASGARYANEKETFVFWNKGDEAFILEGNEQEETYSNCLLSE